MAKPSKMQQRLNNKSRSPLGSVPKHSPSNYNAADTRRSLQAIREVEVEDPRTKFVPSARNVIYMSREKAREYAYAPNDVLISISDIDREAPSLTHAPKEVLALNFNAYVSREERAHGLRGFNDDDAIQIAQFLKRNTESSNIIVHCNMGEVRSRAVATIIAEFFNLRAYTYDHQGGMRRTFSTGGDPDSQRIGFKIYRQLDEHFE